MITAKHHRALRILNQMPVTIKPTQVCGCWLLMLISGLIFWLLMPNELGPTMAISNLAQIAMFLCVGGVGLAFTGLGMWVIACIIGFVGRYVKADYRRGTLFG